jgi:vitamin B12 transporter
MTRASCALVLSASVYFCFSHINTAHGQTMPARPDAGSTLPNAASDGEIEISITANRVPTAIQRTGSAITLIPAEEIRKTNPASLVQVLRDVPGLDVTETGGPGGTTAVRIRGANAGQTLVLIDGIRVNDPSSGSGEFDFATLAPGLIDRVEVLRGPQSALYGSDAIGGVINIITKRGKGPLQTFSQVEGGSYGTISGNAGAHGSKDGITYAFALSALRSDRFSSYGYRVRRVTGALPKLEADSLNRYGGYGRIGFDAGGPFRAEIGTMGTFTRAGYDASFGTFPDTPSTVNSTFHSSYAKAELDTLDDQLKHSIQLYSNRTRRKYDSISFGANMLPANTYLDKYDYIGTRTGVEYQGTYKMGRLGSMMFGGRLEREAIESFSESASPFPFARTKDVGKAQSTRSVFALWQVPVGERIDVSLGGRIDDINKVATFRTWRATAAYRIDETGTKLRASLGTGGKAPTLYQLYAPFFGTATLRPEHSFGGDIGIDQTLLNGRLRLSATAFHNRMRDLIDYDFGTSKYQNIARAETSGIELEAQAKLWEGYLAARGSYTHLRAVDRNTGLRLARRADHSGKFSLTITPTPKWTIEPTLVMMSKRFSSTNQTQRLAPYARLDILTSYQVNETVNVYLRGENLTNARYQDVQNYGTTGRAVYAGLRTQW